mgnify:CR=1 FL=1
MHQDPVVGLDGDEPALADAPFVGAIYTPDEEVGDCHAFCQQLAARLRASGRCEFRLGQAVTAIRRGYAPARIFLLAWAFLLAGTAFAIAAVLSWWTSLPGWAGTLYPMTLGMGLGGVCTAWVALRRVQRDGLPRRSA